MTDSSSLFIDSVSLPWRATPHAGIEWKKLHFDAHSGESAVLLRFAAGTSYAGHLHPGGEEYLVLEGHLQDGDRVHGPGTYVRHPAGSVHRPSSPDGCIVFVRLPRPIVELAEPPPAE